MGLSSSCALETHSAMNRRHNPCWNAAMLLVLFALPARAQSYLVDFGNPVILVNRKVMVVFIREDHVLNRLLKFLK